MTDRERVIKGLEHCSEGGCKECPYEQDCTMADGFSELASDALELLKQQQWVSVKDRLPEKLTLVLVCNHGIYDIAFVGDRGNWVNKLFEPEHWMPLPEPPKEVSE